MFKLKFRKKSMKEVRSIKKWIEKNHFLNNEIWSLYNNPKTKAEIFSCDVIEKIKALIDDYNIVLWTT